MAQRILLWFSALLAVFFLARMIFASDTMISGAGFLLSGAFWYWLSWRKARSLDWPSAK